eukprot:UN26429
MQIGFQFIGNCLFTRRRMKHEEHERGNSEYVENKENQENEEFHRPTSIEGIDERSENVYNIIFIINSQLYHEFLRSLEQEFTATQLKRGAKACKTERSRSEV